MEGERKGGQQKEALDQRNNIDFQSVLLVTIPSHRLTHSCTMISHINPFRIGGVKPGGFQHTCRRSLPTFPPQKPMQLTNGKHVESLPLYVIPLC